MPAMLVLRREQAEPFFQLRHLIGPAERDAAAPSSPSCTIPACCGRSPKRPARCRRRLAHATTDTLRARIGAPVNPTLGVDRIMAWHLRTVLGDALWRAEAGVPLPDRRTPAQWADDLGARFAALGTFRQPQGVSARPRCFCVTSITAMDYEDVVVTFTTDSKQLAATMAAEVASTEFSCCAHIEGPIRRVHRWHGRKHSSEQWRVEIEVTTEGASALVDHITEHHGGEVHDLVVTNNVRHLVTEAAESP